MIALLLVMYVAFADEPAPTAPAETLEESARPAPAAKSKWLDLEHIQCRYGFGIAAGTYYGNVDWNDVGSRWGNTASPVFESICTEKTDVRRRHAWAGVLTAPFYVQFRALDGEARQQWFSGLLGVTWGDRWQFGPVLTAGYPGAGGGLVVRLNDSRSLVDLRVLAYGPFQFGAQAQITYGIIPRKAR